MARSDAVSGKVVFGKHPVTSGEVDWKIDGEGTLTIEGTGRMPDLKGGNHAESLWEDIKDSIRKIYICEGITEIGLRDFEDCRNLTEVHLPSTLKRIRAYAFRNCTALEIVETGNREFRYIYEKEWRKEPENTTVFGIESFAGTPWARDYFGGFYCRDGVLYTCFSGQDPVRIPEGVRTIFRFAFKDVHANVLIMPQSLKNIEDYAFFGAQFGKIWMPREMDYISAGLYEGSLFESIGIERSAIGRRRRVKVPYMYELAVKKIDNYGFDRLVIREKKALAKFGKGKGIWGRALVDVGASLLRRLKRGKVLIGIRYDQEHRIESVKSFVWVKNYGEYGENLIDEYLLYPVLLKDGSVEPYRDSTTFQEEEALRRGFSDMDAEALMKEGAIRFPQPGTSEEWFITADRENFGGAVETVMLEMWMMDHPGFVMDTMQENEMRDRYRIFVDV